MGLAPQECCASNTHTEKKTCTKHTQCWNYTDLMHTLETFILRIRSCLMHPRSIEFVSDMLKIIWHTCYGIVMPMLWNNGGGMAAHDLLVQGKRKKKSKKKNPTKPNKPLCVIDHTSIFWQMAHYQHPIFVFILHFIGLPLFSFITCCCKSSSWNIRIHPFVTSLQKKFLVSSNRVSLPSLKTTFTAPVSKT